MRPIIIGFSRSKLKFPIYSLLIQAFEGTDYSHVYLKWRTNSGVWVVYEASGRAVKFVSHDVFDERSEVVSEFTTYIDDHQYNRMLEFCFRNAGRDYGILQAIGIGLARILNLDYNPLSRGKSHQICSETVLYFLKEVLGLEVSLKEDMAGPRDIYELLSSWDWPRPEDYRG